MIGRERRGGRRSGVARPETDGVRPSWRRESARWGGPVVEAQPRRHENRSRSERNRAPVAGVRPIPHAEVLICTCARRRRPGRMQRQPVGTRGLAGRQTHQVKMGLAPGAVVNWRRAGSTARSGFPPGRLRLGPVSAGFRLQNATQTNRYAGSSHLTERDRARAAWRAAEWSGAA